MGKAAKGSMAQTEVIVDLRKVKELQRLLKAETEGEAVRLAIEESVANRRMTLCIVFWMRWPKNSLLLDSESARRFSVFITAAHYHPYPKPS